MGKEKEVSDSKDVATVEDINGLESSISSLNISVNSKVQELRDMMMHFMQSDKTPNPHPPHIQSKSLL
jgi:hypothetical protein